MDGILNNKAPKERRGSFSHGCKRINTDGRERKAILTAEHAEHAENAKKGTFLTTKYTNHTKIGLTTDDTDGTGAVGQRRGWRIEDGEGRRGDFNRRDAETRRTQRREIFGHGLTGMNTDGEKGRPFPYPKGIESFSPGLFRPRNHPGNIHEQNFYPEGVASPPGGRFNPFGVDGLFGAGYPG